MSIKIDKNVRGSPIQVLFRGKYNTFRFMVIQKKITPASIHTHVSLDMLFEVK